MSGADASAAEGADGADVDVLIIGAGQAGLSVGYWLRRYGGPGADVRIVDADDRPGGAWAHRWDSLRLSKTHHVHDLPGLAMGPVDAERRASDVVSEYFGRYEQTMDLRVLRPIAVEAVTAPDGPRLLARAGDRSWSARFVVNATGTWTRPFIPSYPGQDRFAGLQLHTADFRRAEDLAGQRVMVVGGGASAVQLLAEISEVADTIWVTRRDPHWQDGPFSEDLGREVIARVDARTRAGEPPTSIVSNTGLFRSALTADAERRGVYARRPMFARLGAHEAIWADGSREPIDAILWATGFRPAIAHLAPLHLRTSAGGIRVVDGRAVDEPRLFLAGYGPSASTIGANRAGRSIARQIHAHLPAVEN